VSQHIGDTQLRAFVAGTLREDLAVEIAEHVDDCSSCSSRASALDPLSAVFATVRDPRPPPDLVAKILVRVERSDRVPTREVAIGIALLAAAVGVAFASGSPAALAAEVGVLVDAFVSLGRGLATGLASFPVAVSLVTLAALVGSVLTLRLAVLQPGEGGLLSAARRSS
jgi:hypothetical protein